MIRSLRAASPTVATSITAAHTASAHSHAHSGAVSLAAHGIGAKAHEIQLLLGRQMIPYAQNILGNSAL